MGQLAAAKPAAADGTCSTYWFCMWQHANSGGWKVEYYPSRFVCYTLPSSYWDQVTSYWNRTGHTIFAYTLQNCTGSSWNIYGTEYTGSVGWPWNDEMRSFWVN
jgi:hypothetical protein